MSRILGVFYGLATLMMACSTADGGNSDGAGGGNEGGATGGEPNGGAGSEPSASGESGAGAGGETMAAGGGGQGPLQGGKGGASGSGGAKGGAGGRGGSGGAGTGGAITQGGSSPVVSGPCSGNARCDDFESYSAGNTPAGPWSNFDRNGGTIAVDTTRAFSGTKAVKMTINPGGSTVRMRHAGNGLLPADNLFLRMMVYLDATPTGDALHWHWMRVEGNVGGESGGKLSKVFMGPGGSVSGSTWTLYGGDASTGGYQDCFVSGDQKLPTAQWACVEFQADGTGDNLRTWIKGKLDDFTEITAKDPIPGLGGCIPGHDFTANKWFVPKVETVYFGWSLYHTLAATRTLWIDDVVVSNQRIGCPAM